MKPVKLCKRGHERTPENINKYGACKDCIQIKRTENARKRGVRERKEGFCFKGHEMTPSNTYSDGHCKSCVTEHNKTEARQAVIKNYRKSNSYKLAQKLRKQTDEYKKYDALRMKKLRAARPDIKAYEHSRNRRLSDELSDTYLIHVMRERKANVSPSLIALKREQLIHARIVREGNTIIKEYSNVNI